MLLNAIMYKHPCQGDSRIDPPHYNKMRNLISIVIHYIFRSKCESSIAIMSLMHEKVLFQLSGQLNVLDNMDKEMLKHYVTNMLSFPSPILKSLSHLYNQAILNARGWV